MLSFAMNRKSPGSMLKTLAIILIVSTSVAATIHDIHFPEATTLSLKDVFGDDAEITKHEQAALAFGELKQHEAHRPNGDNYQLEIYATRAQLYFTPKPWSQEELAAILSMDKKQLLVVRLPNTQNSVVNPWPTSKEQLLPCSLKMSRTVNQEHWDKLSNGLVFQLQDQHINVPSNDERQL